MVVVQGPRARTRRAVSRDVCADRLTGDSTSGTSAGASVPRQGYGYTGNTGSRHLGILLAEQYNRRRIFTTWFKQWITRDPLWPEELAYGYVNGNPTTWIDPRGLLTLLASALCFAPRPRWVPIDIWAKLCPESPLCSGQKPPYISDEIWKILCPAYNTPDYPKRPRLGFTEDFGFLYGNYCGRDRCNSKETPLDCVDYCCMEHDYGITGATEKDYLDNPRVIAENCALAACATNCLLAGCALNSGSSFYAGDYFDRVRRCQEAARLIAWFFSMACLAGRLNTIPMPPGGGGTPTWGGGYHPVREI